MYGRSPSGTSNRNRWNGLNGKIRDVKGIERKDLPITPPFEPKEDQLEASELKFVGKGSSDKHKRGWKSAQRNQGSKHSGKIQTLLFGQAGGQMLSSKLQRFGRPVVFQSLLA